jgi:predicted AAA+ superfamily ATPase
MSCRMHTVANRLRAPLHDTEKGTLLETWVLHELRAHLQIAQCGGEINWYRTGGGVEVDFIWCGAEHHVASRSRRANGGVPSQEAR